ncbi:hypothetical protein TrST_g3785 [Triparma strigata]|uniref:NlpC/P60 domain-containing protein n=1 Tax=Triparma strigata TaxID=1606541 RepID=A0A9W7E646_9STRA|nr:hypothetical protein TrST_g3785 [Triparma strigata]
MLSPLKENDMNLPQPVLSPSKQASNPNAGNPGIPSGNPPAPSSEPSDEDIMLQLAGKTEKAAGGSLQGNFAKFRAERARQKKLARANKKHLKESPKTQEQKDALRIKFVEQCKKYMGVPYHPSYHKDPSSPYHGAPLYLDCCGLTRRALQDLAEDFGFVIGPGNQAYQFETCPEEVAEADLKPGDLIFTAGTYFKEGKKPQKHDMVHIEVFIGGGESGLQTIGARRQTGVVEILPSYKFESKSYKITKQYLRSLDTWISGKCAPLLDPKYWETKFKTNTAHLDSCPDKKSVFDACDDDEDNNEGEALDENAKYFYVNKSNGWKLVSDALEKRGFTRLPFEYNFRTQFDLKWVEGRSAINYAQHQDGQLVNHISNNDVITNKIGLLTTLQDAYGADFPPAFFPMTYRLDRPADVLQMLENIEGDEENKFWIHKPSGKNCGKGIEVITSEAVKELVTKPKDEENNENAVPSGAVGEDDVIESRYSNLNLENGLVQKYLTKPLLLNGKKFDIRVYGLVSRCTPTQFTSFYHHGYVRLSLEDFTMDEARLGDKFVHLTNASVQKKHQDYKERGVESIWSFDQLGEYLVANGKAESKEAAIEDLNDKFQFVINSVLKSAKNKFNRKRGFFDLLGFDFMLSEDLSPVLLEVNTNPALHLDCKVMEDVIPNAVEETMDLVMKSHEMNEDGTEVLKSGKQIAEEVGGRFQLLNDTFDEGFDYAGRFGVGKGIDAVKALRLSPRSD